MFPGFGAAWHLNKVVLINQLTNTSYTFPCGRWLAKNEDDKKVRWLRVSFLFLGSFLFLSYILSYLILSYLLFVHCQIVRELPVSEKLGLDQHGRVQNKAVAERTLHKYHINVFTGDVRGAGTDANVFVTCERIIYCLGLVWIS